MSISQKKWSSFNEMYDDLKKDPIFSRSIENDLSRKISSLVLEIENTNNSKGMFDVSCKLSSFFESLDKNTTHDVYTKTNVYVLVLNAVFHNPVFIEILVEVSSKKEQINNLKKDSSEFEKLIFLNTSILLAFEGIAIDHQSITESSIEFLRKNTTDLLKNIVKTSGYKIDFVDLCFFLEKVSWDHAFSFNQNFESKFPVKLNSTVLFDNLKTSRAFAGITFTSLVIRPAIERRFRNIISTIDNEGNSLSSSLNAVYDATHQISERIKHYYRNSSNDITGFFNIFIRQNEKDLIFCFERFCAGFHYQRDQKKFFESILDKTKTATAVKNELMQYVRENFRAFTGKINGGDQWTNKIFLTSIKTLSILDEIKDAQDSKWVVSVAIHELYEWMKDVHAVLNKHYIEDDWEKIKYLVQKEDEKIEWKSSFFTPVNQPFVDTQTDSILRADMFDKIVKVILAMLNTEGGDLIIGLVENPEKVRRDEVQQFFIERGGITFFDISYELKRDGKTLDHIRLKILDKLHQITDNSVDEFNNLIDLEPIMIRSNEQVVSIIKISIKKSIRPFFNVLKQNESIWVSLTRRAHGRNVDVDIRKHL